MADEELEPRLLSLLAADAEDVWYRDARLWGGVACLGIALGSWRMARRQRQAATYEDSVDAALADTAGRNWLLDSLDEALTAPVGALAAATDSLFGATMDGKHEPLLSAA